MTVHTFDPADIRAAFAGDGAAMLRAGGTARNLFAVGLADEALGLVEHFTGVVVNGSSIEIIHDGQLMMLPAAGRPLLEPLRDGLHGKQQRDRLRRRASSLHIDELRARDEAVALDRVATGRGPRPAATPTVTARGEELYPLVWGDGSPIGSVGFAALKRLVDKGALREVRDGERTIGYEVSA